MKAVILEDGKLSIKETPVPKPGIEQALIKISSTGVCHSDLHLAKGDWPQMLPPYPIPLGHEGIGIIEELGPGADRHINKGDRVIFGLGGEGGAYWCGACEYCLGGTPRLCQQARPLIGTYAEYISVWAKALVKLPDAVGDDEVSLACGGLTAYGAVKKLLDFHISPGKTVAMIGAAGGLGHYAVQIAKSFGYKVVGIDIGQEKVKFIKEIGADYSVDADDALGLVKGKLKGVSASIVFTPNIAGFELGFKLLKPRGLFIGVGMPPSDEGSFSIHPLQLLKKDPVIISSAVGTVEDMRELVRMAAEGRVKSHVSRKAKLSELEQVFSELREGRYPGRAIINDLAG